MQPDAFPGDHAGSDACKGYVSRLQRACTGDGPGYRTTVFLQGCPLLCPWCHNPDYRPAGSSLSRNPHRCIACGRCDVQAAADMEQGDRVDSGKLPERVAACPAAALTLLGREMTVAEVMRIVERDREYYHATGGGLTLSGGEPLLQPDFVLALLAAAHRASIHTAIETSCGLPQVLYQRVAAAGVDLFLCDIKASRSAYPRLIGVSPEMILANLATLAASGADLQLRVPLVAGVNCDDGLLDFIVEAALVSRAKAVELLPYHNFGRGKAAMAGLPEPEWSTMRAPDSAELSAFRQQLQKQLACAAISAKVIL